MSILDLRKLSKLNKIDHAILEIRKRAAALDPGKTIQGQIDKLTADFNAKNDDAKKLQAELTDLELQQKNIGDKIKKIDKELYGGKVVNPREVENFEKEIEALKKQRSNLDERIMELWELGPPAKKLAEDVQAQIDEKKNELGEYQKKVVVFRKQLEDEFKRLSALRPEAVKEVPPALLARYEAIKQKYGGIGMAEVVKGNSCGECGTLLPEKLVEGAKEGRVVTCESCHRILYASEGMI